MRHFKESPIPTYECVPPVVAIDGIELAGVQEASIGLRDAQLKIVRGPSEFSGASAINMSAEPVRIAVAAHGICTVFDASFQGGELCVYHDHAVMTAHFAMLSEPVASIDGDTHQARLLLERVP